MIVGFSVSFLCGFAEGSFSDIEKALLAKDFAQAEKLAQAIINQQPIKSQEDTALYYLAVSRLQQNNYSQARDDFNKLINNAPEGNLLDKAYLGIHDTFYREEQYVEALSVLEKLLYIKPRSDFLSVIYLQLARSNLKLAHWKKARTYLRRIVNEFPESLEYPIAKEFLEEKQYFAVQVGAFIRRELAEKLVAELQQHGEYAYILEATDQINRKFYRVRVGKLALLNQAKELQSKLTQLGYPTRIYP